MKVKYGKLLRNIDKNVQISDKILMKDQNKYFEELLEGVENVLREKPQRRQELSEIIEFTDEEIETQIKELKKGKHAEQMEFKMRHGSTVREL